VQNTANPFASQIRRPDAASADRFSPAENTSLGIPVVGLLQDSIPRLLDFVAALIIDAARTDPRITEKDVALWLARVVLGARR
jgi:hypothetical protein